MSTAPQPAPALDGAAVADSLPLPSHSLALPPALPVPLDVPRYFLDARQEAVVARRATALAGTALPAWLPHAQVSASLGFNDSAIRAAVRRFGVYVWAPHFENVHSVWVFDEPGFEYRGVSFAGPEQLFQLQKHGNPGTPEYDAHAAEFARASPMEAYALGRRARLRPDWESVKEAAMRAALRCKFTDPVLAALLRATHPAPLVSVKADAYWGAGLDGTGANRLGALLMELREALVRDTPAPPDDAAPACRGK